MLLTRTERWRWILQKQISYIYSSAVWWMQEYAGYCNNFFMFIHKLCLTSQNLRKLQGQKETNLPVQVCLSVKQHPTLQNIVHTTTPLYISCPGALSNRALTHLLMSVVKEAARYKHICYIFCCHSQMFQNHESDLTIPYIGWLAEITFMKTQMCPLACTLLVLFFWTLWSHSG